jgi:hypothetical protein
VDSPFLDNFLANLLATFLGVLFGIPAGMYLSSRQEAKARAERLQEARERRRQLLTLTRAELAFNLEKLPQRERLAQEKAIAMYLGPRLKTELWTTLSDGGELKWIADLELMSVLADVYYRLKEAAHLESRYLHLLTDPSPHEAAQRDLCQMMFLEYRKARETAEDAIRVIDAALTST